MVVIFWHNPCTAVLQACTAVHQSITTHSASSRQLSSWIIRTIVVQTREICWSANNEKTMSGRGGPSYSYAALPQSEICSCAAKRTFNSEDARFVSHKLFRFLDQLELNFQFHLIVCSVLFSSVFYILCSSVNWMPWNRTLLLTEQFEWSLARNLSFLRLKVF